MPEKFSSVTNTPLGKTNSAAWRQPQKKSGKYKIFLTKTKKTEEFI